MILFFVNFFFSFGAAVLVAGWKTNSVQPQFLVVVVVKKNVLICLSSEVVGNIMLYNKKEKILILTVEKNALKIGFKIQYTASKSPNNRWFRYFKRDRRSGYLLNSSSCTC